MKKTLIFDLGGVLIDWDPRHLYRKIFSDPERMEYFLAEICSPEWNAQMDGEKSFQDGVAELADLHPRYAKHIEAYHTRWEEMVAGLIPGSLELLEELRGAGYPLAALSNWSSETFPLVHARYEFLDWFDPLVISGQVGLVKPDPQIFALIICAVDREPEDCIYVDDIQVNVSAAADQGLDAILFTSADQLRTSLIERKVLPI